MKKAVFLFFCAVLMATVSFAFNVTAVVAAASCINSNDGIIIVTPAGGTAPYTYTINPGNIISSSNTITGLAPGSYNITVIDALGDTGSTTVVVGAGSFPSSTSINVTVCSNQLPYHFNSSDIYSPGVYSDTLTNMGGCDSIVILNLSITPAPSSNSNVSICVSQLPYVWNGQSYNAAGVYHVNFPGLPGECDSTATLHLVVVTADVWTGAVNNLWEEPLNWSCGLPGIYSDVIINFGTVILNSNATINSLTTAAGVNLTIASGSHLTVLH
ncbi:MAG: SprB repeat-containing protein [Ferruginibacter sp.]